MIICRSRLLLHTLLRLKSPEPDKIRKGIDILLAEGQQVGLAVEMAVQSAAELEQQRQFERLQGDVLDDPALFAQQVEFAEDLGLDVVDVDLEAGRVVLQGRLY